VRWSSERAVLVPPPPPRKNVSCSWAGAFLVTLLLGVTLRCTSIPSSGEVEVLLVASCYRNLDKVRSDGPLALLNSEKSNDHNE